MSEYSWPEGNIASGEGTRATWAATCAALPIGCQVTGMVIGRQPFGVFLTIDGIPDAVGLAEISSIPKNLELPKMGTQVTGEVIWHAEHNHQVKIRLIQSSDDQRWAEIDPLILARSNIHALILIRESFSCSLRPAVELLDERYTLLQHTQPEDFAPPKG